MSCLHKNYESNGLDDLLFILKFKQEIFLEPTFLRNIKTFLVIFLVFKLF